MKIEVQLQNEIFKSSVTLHEWVPNNSQEQHQRQIQKGPVLSLML